DLHAHTILNHNSIHQSHGSCVIAAATVRIPASLLCEEASKVESCPSEIILDDLLALDSIVRFDLGDRKLEQTATFSISTNSE
nr:hypothetical protein [Tanacetum cinerariifolium]